MNSDRSANDPFLNSKVLLKLTFIAFATIWMMDIINPFGTEDMMDDLSARAYNGIMAPFYGAPDRLTLDTNHADLLTNAGQKEIVVVLLKDESRWPLSIRSYQRFLSRIENAGALGAFIDIYFSPSDASRNDQIRQLYDEWAIRQPNASGATVPFKVVFASTLFDPYLDAVFQPSELKQNRNVVKPQAVIAQTLVDPGYYRLYDEDTQLQSPALAMFNHWCQSAPESKKSCQTELDLNKDMYIQWGFAPGRVMTDVEVFGGANCQRQSSSLVKRFTQSLEIFLRGALTGFPDSGSNNRPDELLGITTTSYRCPYNTQISLQAFNLLPREDLRNLVKDKIILFGAAVDYYPDLHHSPVHGYIPGVFYHAMALDNLMESGNSYLRESFERARYLVIPLIAMMIMLAQLYLFRLTETGTMSVYLTGKRLLVARLAIGLLVLFVLSLTMSSFAFFHYSPVNWLGITALVITAEYQIVKVLLGCAWSMRPFSTTFLEDTPRLNIPVWSFLTNRLAIPIWTMEIANMITWLVFTLLLLIAGYIVLTLPLGLLTRYWQDSSTVFPFIAASYITMITLLILVLNTVLRKNPLEEPL